MLVKTLYQGEAPAHRHEDQKFNTLAAKLKQEFSDSLCQEHLYLIGNLRTTTRELDAVLICNRVVIGLEFKDYGAVKDKKGILEFGQNEWKCDDVVVKGGSGNKTPYLQSRTNRASLVSDLNRICAENRISTNWDDHKKKECFVNYWVVFNKPVTFDESSSIYNGYTSEGWFRITDNRYFVELFVALFNARKQQCRNREVDVIKNAFMENLRTIEVDAYKDALSRFNAMDFKGCYEKLKHDDSVDALVLKARCVIGLYTDGGSGRRRVTCEKRRKSASKLSPTAAVEEMIESVQFAPLGSSRGRSNDDNDGLRGMLPARELLLIAKNHGSKEADYWLGYMFENGIEVEKDSGKAWEHYRSAQDKGSRDAREAVKRIVRSTLVDKAGDTYCGTIKLLFNFLAAFIGLILLGNTASLCTFEPEIVNLSRYFYWGACGAFLGALTLPLWRDEWLEKFKGISERFWNLPAYVLSDSWTKESEPQSFLHLLTPVWAWGLSAGAAYLLIVLSTWGIFVRWSSNFFPLTYLLEVAGLCLLVLVAVCGIVNTAIHVSRFALSKYVIRTSSMVSSIMKSFSNLAVCSLLFSLFVVLPNSWFGGEARKTGVLGVLGSCYTWNYQGPVYAPAKNNEVVNKAEESGAKTKKSTTKAGKKSAATTKKKSAYTTTPKRSTSIKADVPASYPPVNERFYDYAAYESGRKLPVYFSKTMSFAYGSAALCDAAKNELREFAANLMQSIKTDRAGKTVVVGVVTSEEVAEKDRYGKGVLMDARARTVTKILREAGLRCQIVFLTDKTLNRGMYINTSTL